MQTLPDISSCRAAVRSLQRGGATVGFVPTMGALHEGHVSLIRAANTRCDHAVVSIFVNPTQFGPKEDLAAYPRPLEKDLAICKEAGVSLVFAPTAEAMYPPGSKTVVHVKDLGQGLCGPFRPGHFDGVATVVAKLFQIVPADAAFFGEKDYQQLAIIRRMAVDLNIPIEIVACPTVREPDGLAMSSRNAYLSPAERRQAVSISQGLFAAAEQAKRGERNRDQLVSLVRETIEAAGPASIEYIELVNPETLDPMPLLNRPARLCAAVRIGKTRLIDIVTVGSVKDTRQ